MPARVAAAALALVFGALLGAGLLGCGPDLRERRAADPRPNVLLVSIDTVRADHLSLHGYARDTSPHLIALAQQGVRFDLAYAPSATTGPSHATLFTSLPPPTHRVVRNGRTLGTRHETLAEILADAGFETGGVISSFVLSPGFGFDQGFGYYDDDFSGAEVPSGSTVWEGRVVEGKFYGRADDTTDRALRWLDGRARPDRPFFLFVHYFDPHDPYHVPPGYRPPFEPGPREQLKLPRTIFFYDALLAYTDREIGRLLAGLAERGLEDDTLVVVTGDHGEGLMQHGHMLHGAQVYEESVRVPLIMRGPGLAPGDRVIAEPVALLDLAPTLLDWIGVARPAQLQGRSLAPLLRGEVGEDPDRPVHLYRRDYGEEGEQVADGIVARGEMFALREGRWKLIDGPDEGRLELYDLASDPRERVNLADGQPARVERMRAALRDWRERVTRPDEAMRELSPEDRMRLEALGYAQ